MELPFTGGYKDTRLDLQLKRYTMYVFMKNFGSGHVTDETKW